MMVLGVDAALNRCGLAWVIEGKVTWASTVRAGRTDSLVMKLANINDAVAQAISKNRLLEREDPPWVVIEQPGNWARGKVKSSQHTVEVLAMARAAAMLGVIDAGMGTDRVVQLPVNEARDLVLGFRGAVTKEEVMMGLAHLVKPGVLRDPDQADAAVVALAGEALARAKDPRFG